MTALLFPRYLSGTALGLRAGVVIFAGVATALLPSVNAFVVVPAAAAAVLAVAAPATVGVVPLLLVEIVAWIAGYGTDADVPGWRAAAFGVALYFAHSATALTAVAGAGTGFSGDVVTHWARHAVPGAAAAVVIAVALAIGRTGTESVAIDVVGLAAVALVVAALAWLALRR